MKLKRVWDTTEKKIARVPGANGKPCQVWYGLETEKFYKQDINGLVEITDEDFNVYGPNWKLVESDDVLGYYDTDEPTDLGNPEDGDEATYTFKDYDGTVLKTGKVKDGETPEAPEDPTRAGYKFAGWKPKVKAIYKDTTYTAQYEENLCTVTLNVKNGVEKDGAIVAAEDQDPLRATRTPVSVQVPAGCIITGDQSLTDEEMEAGMSSLDFMLPDFQDGDEPAASFKFTPVSEGSYISAQYNFDEIIDVEGAAADENNNVIITGDATLPIYLMKGDE